MGDNFNNSNRQVRLNFKVNTPNFAWLLYQQK